VVSFLSQERIMMIAAPPTFYVPFPFTQYTFILPQDPTEKQDTIDYQKTKEQQKGKSNSLVWIIQPHSS
jgi:hypothetical protein